MNRESEKCKTRSRSKNSEVLKKKKRRRGGGRGMKKAHQTPHPAIIKNYLQYRGKINHIKSLSGSPKLGWMLLLKLNFKFIVRDALN